MLAPPPLPVALPGPTTVSAYHGTVAYSRLDPRAGKWSLVVNGRTARISPRSAPFDVDLGPDASGRTVAVYSRCAKDPNPNFGDGAMHYPDGYAQGCRVYLYDPATDRERPVANASGFMPAIWRNTVVYAVGSALYARVNGRVHRLDDGPRGRDVTFTGIDLAGTRVAVAREAGTTTQMVLTGIGRRATVVESRRNGISTRAMRFPALSGGRLYYAETCAGDPASCSRRFVRYTPSTRARAFATSPSMYLTGFAQDGADAFYVRAPTDAWGADRLPVTVARTQPRYVTKA